MYKQGTPPPLFFSVSSLKAPIASLPFSNCLLSFPLTSQPTFICSFSLYPEETMAELHGTNHWSSCDVGKILHQLAGDTSLFPVTLPIISCWQPPYLQLPLLPSFLPTHQPAYRWSDPIFCYSYLLYLNPTFLHNGHLKQLTILFPCILSSQQPRENVWLVQGHPVNFHGKVGPWTWISHNVVWHSSHYNFIGFHEAVAVEQ